MSQPEPDAWSYSTGRRGVSRVRVYERYPGGPIQIEYTGALRQTLTNMADVPVTDRGIAQDIADALSKRLERGAQQKVASEVLGMPRSRTLAELLEQYHKDKAAGWSAKHKSTQEALRDWWIDRLGGRTQLRQVNEAAVERTVRESGDRGKWSRRTRQKYIRYIKAAFRYAHRKLKWIHEDHNLTDVDVPTPDRGGPSYTRAEMFKLLAMAPEVDWRVDVALHIAYDAQARSRAVIHLRPSDYLGDGLLRFAAEYDKAGKERTVVLTPTTRWKVEAALRRPEVQAAGWLLPEAGGPIRYDRLLELLEAVETRAKVPKVPGRGWHAVKRRSVTDAIHASRNRKAVSQQAGTTEATLERIYEQDDMEPKRELAAALERLRRGP